MKIRLTSGFGLRASGFAASALVASATNVTIAQTEKPTFYFFQNVHPAAQANIEPAGWVHDPRFNGMVMINVSSGAIDADPVNAANKAMNFIQQRLSSSPPTLDLGNIPIVIAGFAHCGSNTTLPTCIIDSSDIMTTTGGQPVSWPNNFINDPANKPFLHLNPWIGPARLRLKDWITDFMMQVRSRHETDGIPMPTRIIIDSEDPLVGCCEPNWSLNMQNVRSDARWNTAHVPGYPSGTTMASLEAATNAYYGWNLYAGDYSTPVQAARRQGFSASEIPSEIRNRPYSQWYSTVVRRVKAAVLKETAYDVIQDVYAQMSLPMPAVGNYGDQLTDGAPDTFGWFEDKNVRVNAAGVQQIELTSYNPPYRNSWGRFLVDSNNEGSRYGHTLLDDTLTPQARWFMFPTSNWASRDCPVLYDKRVYPNPLYTHKQKHAYVPGSPTETFHQTMLRLNRHRTESSLWSVSTENPDRVMAPFVYVPNRCGDFNIRITERSTVEHLLMLRGLRTLEIHPFAPNAPALSEWEAMKRCYQRAYSFEAVDAEWTSPANFVSDLYRIHYSTRVSGVPQVVQSLSSSVDTKTELRVTFDRLEVASHPGDALLIHLECQVSEPGVVGRVLAWDFSAAGGGNYVWLIINDDPASPTNYLFTTPDRSTRRDFIIPAADVSRFVSSNGEVRLAFVHTSSASFTSTYDLIQVAYVPTPVGAQVDCVPPNTGEVPPEEEEGGMAERAGADVNFDQSIDGHDSTVLLQAYLDGSTLADYDGNGVIDIEDINLFVLDFAGQN